MAFPSFDITNLRKRRCFHCGKSIKFGEFFLRNRYINESRLFKLWQNPYIEFYCCLCYDTIKEEKECEEVKSNLHQEQREVVYILERILKREIPVLKTINYQSFGIVIKDRNIIGLGLHRAGLCKIPSEITYLHFLEKINLSWNFLDIFPEEICNLDSLQEIDLLGNKIKSITQKIMSLKNLEYLDLSFNEIQVFPKKLSKLRKLKCLKLIKNNIIQIPTEIKNLENNGLKLLL